MVIVGYLIGEIGKLRFQRWPPVRKKTLAYIAKPPGVFPGTVLEYAFARLKAQVQAIKCPITLLQHIYDSQ